jgi:hypothetical protein
VSLTKGIHSLTFGFNVERIQDIETGCGNCGGNYQFTSIPNLLGNQPSKFIAQFNPLTNHMFETIFGAFVQDNIRLRPNLTINAGLRYEMATVPTEANGKDGSLHSLDGVKMFNGDPVFHNPSLRNCWLQLAWQFSCCVWSAQPWAKISWLTAVSRRAPARAPPPVKSSASSAMPLPAGTYPPVTVLIRGASRTSTLSMPDQPLPGTSGWF